MYGLVVVGHYHLYHRICLAQNPACCLRQSGDSVIDYYCYHIRLLPAAADIALHGADIAPVAGTNYSFVADSRGVVHPDDYIRHSVPNDYPDGDSGRAAVRSFDLTGTADDCLYCPAAHSASAEDFADGCYYMHPADRIADVEDFVNDCRSYPAGHHIAGAAGIALCGDYCRFYGNCRDSRPDKGVFGQTLRAIADYPYYLLFRVKYSRVKKVVWCLRAVARLRGARRSPAIRQGDCFA